MDGKIRSNDRMKRPHARINLNTLCESVMGSSPKEVKISKIVLVQVQISNLYIEKTCKVGSYFFGNGTTYEDEVENREAD